MANEVKKMGDTISYTSLQISNRDARIDDNESNLREIMGKVDRIQEDLQRFIAMNQSSRVNGETVEAVLLWRRNPSSNLETTEAIRNMHPFSYG